MNVYKLNSNLPQIGTTLTTTTESILTPAEGTLVLVSASGDNVIVTNNESDTTALGGVTLKDNKVLIEATGSKIKIRLVDQITVGQKAFVTMAIVEASSILTSFKK